MNKELRLVREDFTTVSTIGSLFWEGEWQCFILEDEDRALEAGGVKIFSKTAIPRGRYQIVKDWSPKYGREMPHILDVPGFEGIRIHPGNEARDTEGCLITGREKVKNYVRDSKAAYVALLLKLEAAWDAGDEVWITIA
jgi:hypothetical protein